MRLQLFVLVSCILHQSLQKSTPQDDHYVAAVVEYEVSNDVEKNRLAYMQLTAEAAQQNADIVVFPELTLTNASVSFSVPINGLLKEYPIPALHPELYDSLLVSMSAAARNNQIYLLINTRELVDCVANNTGEECPEAKQYIFNTNVVFDRSGAVIDRYRKINLFGEYTHTAALHPDLGVFTTDFGVKFGHFICFDLMFQVPAVQVVQKEKVTDVIFSTMWFSEMPYLTAVQIQEAYAYIMDVNFIASGANNVLVGSAGSGIYSGKAGALVSIMPGVPTTRLLVSKVPKVPGQVKEPYPGPIYDNPSDHDSLRLIRDPSLPAHVSKPLVPGFQEFTLVDKDVSCNFRVRLEMSNAEQALRFRAVIQDGITTYARRDLGVAACTIVSCENDDFKSCPYKYNPKETPAVFQELSIEMRTYSHQYNKSLECDNIVYFPVSLRTNKFPLGFKNATYTDSRTSDNLIKAANDANDLSNSQNGGYKENGGRDDVTYKINLPQDNLVAFGIWGRIFARDVDHNTNISEDDYRRFATILDVIYGLKKNDNVF